MRKWIALCVGFATMCPVQVTAGAGLRLNDVVAVLLVGAAGASILSAPRSTLRLSRAYAAIVLLTIGWIGADLTFRVYLPENPGATMIMVRWIVAIPAAFYLALLCRDPVFRKFMFLGLALGALGTTMLLVFDYVSFQATGQPAFTSDETRVTWVGSDYRAIGILSHPNGAAIGSLFVVPFLVGMAEEFGWNRFALIVAPSIMAAVFYVTQNRSAMIASTVILVLWGLTRRAALVFAAFAAVLVVIAGAYLFTAADPLAPGDDANLISMLVTRFTDETNLDNNASERMQTTITSLELALGHPFGLGSTYETPLDQLTGFTATHNAFMQLALMGGLPLSMLVMVLLLGTLVRLVTQPRSVYRPIHHWVALYLMIVSLFEAAFYIPFFSTVVLWVIARELVTERATVAYPSGTADLQEVARLAGS